MATSRIKTSSVLQGFPKSRSLLAGNAAYEPSSYESIATTTLSTTATSVTFSSIPGTYTHLQVRYICYASSQVDLLGNFNSDTGSNYSRHYLYGDGSAVASGAAAPDSAFNFGFVNNTGNYFISGITDILDYADTNKYKTTRTLTGFDTNGGGYILMYSGNWRNTNAINSITIKVNSGSLQQYSEFALYGIKA